MPTSDFAFLNTAGAAGRNIAQSDRTSHPLGPIACWPPVLRTALSIMLSSRFPSCIAWTDQLHTLFNEPYQELLAGRPGALQGAAMGVLWPEVADAVVSICSRAFAGESMFSRICCCQLHGTGVLDRTFLRFPSALSGTSKASLAECWARSSKRPKKSWRWLGIKKRKCVTGYPWNPATWALDQSTLIPA
jgi:hypothetical protein